jgi:hypothetical protein
MIKWTLFDVLTAVHREKIQELAVSLSKDKAGSTLFIGNYKKALKQFSGELTESEREGYIATAKEWTEKGLPVDMRQRYVHSSDSSGLKLTHFFTPE